MFSVCLVVVAGACGGADENAPADELGSDAPSGDQAPTAEGVPAFSGTWTIIAYLTAGGFSSGAVDPSATFELVDDRIVGTTGCRRFEFPVERSGEYAEAGAIGRNLRGQAISVSVSEIDGETASCDEAVAEQDTELPLAFARARRWAIDGDTFFLLGDDHNEIVAQRSS